MRPATRHSRNQSLLQRRMLLYFIAGGAFAVLHVTELRWFLFDLLAVTFFACYVVLFGLYWHGRQVQERELWRTGDGPEKE